ncbi:hypothetical protein D9611_002214 [Ephemerocybe angulata]|uniref:DUF2423 domain-containing protein n=1 Tax=Ephemerocybe angulata TaxID=980116 RepID=A0A8H5C296_9AGAR|nr:hypothetical protein D9611_002214 [Tulosesus angulatus]
MAKSLRSKVKRSFRNKKREEGVYAAVHAARLQRLNSKLIETAKKDVDGDVSLDAPAGEESADVPGWLINALAFMPYPQDIQLEDLAYLSGHCGPTTFGV